MPAPAQPTSVGTPARRTSLASVGSSGCATTTSRTRSRASSHGRSRRHSRCGRVSGSNCGRSTPGRGLRASRPRTSSPSKRSGPSDHTNMRPTDMLTSLSLLLALHGVPPRAGNPVRVVTSLTTYAAIAREVVGERGTVTSIANGDENPHYVQPKPSFVPTLSQADLFVTTGLDLELWVPALLDKANNTKVTEGGPGYVAAYAGIDLLDVPTSFSRAQGDIHVYVNPHIWTDPMNAVQIARNILTGLRRVSPEDADYFTGRERDFEDRMYRALFGDELVKLLGGATLADLDRQGKLPGFLPSQADPGTALVTRLGGWLKEALAFPRKAGACYHKEWGRGHV